MSRINGIINFNGSAVSDHEIRLMNSGIVNTEGRSSVLCEESFGFGHAGISNMHSP